MFGRSTFVKDEDNIVDKNLIETQLKALDRARSKFNSWLSSDVLHFYRFDLEN